MLSPSKMSVVEDVVLIRSQSGHIKIYDFFSDVVSAVLKLHPLGNIEEEGNDEAREDVDHQVKSWRMTEKVN